MKQHLVEHLIGHHGMAHRKTTDFSVVTRNEASIHVLGDPSSPIMKKSAKGQVYT